MGHLKQTFATHKTLLGRVNLKLSMRLWKVCEGRVVARVLSVAAPSLFAENPVICSTAVKCSSELPVRD